MALRRSICVSVLLGASVLLQTNAYAARFIDTSGAWTEKYINRLSDKGFIPAESDGKFNPTKPVTRAQLAVWLVKVLGLDGQPVPATSSFPDVKKTDSYFSAVEIIRQNNYIAGYADGFRPNQFIQRAEVMTIMSRALNLPQPSPAHIEAELSKFSDGKAVPDWAKVGVTLGSEAGILADEGSPKLLKPTAIATRGDTIAMLSLLDEYLGKKSVESASSASPTGQPAQNSSGEMFATNTGAPPQSPQGPPVPVYGAPNGAYAQGYPNPYAGQVSAQGQFQAPPLYPVYQQGYGAQYATPPALPSLQGGLAIVAAGTHFRAELKNTLNSGSTQRGEQVQATLGEPLYSNGAEVIPAGSRIIGSVTNVISAKRFKAGANGKIDIRFTAIETPDGRRFPLSASVDGKQVHLTGGTTGGRVGKGLMTTAVGAGGGAALGTALGAIVGATGGGSVGKSTAMGAVFGTAIGGGAGAVGAVVRKGSEVKLPAGLSIPIQLDQSLQVTPPAQQPYKPNY